MNELLNELLQQCRAIRPEVQYVELSTYCGDTSLTIQFWAFTDSRALGGGSMIELLDELRESVGVAA